LWTKLLAKMLQRSSKIRFSDNTLR
jgi:hypothetical protein